VRKKWDFCDGKAVPQWDVGAGVGGRANASAGSNRLYYWFCEPAIDF
jgi:hypothetical protein